MKRHLYDAHGSVVTTFHYDGHTDTTTIERSQDCEPILDHNKAAQSEVPYRSDWQRRMASIPLAVAEKWMREDGVNWLALSKKERTAYLRRKLNDPHWRYLKTDPGVF